MSDPDATYHGGYMYDVRGRAMATRNSNGEYIDYEGRIRATSRASSRASTRYSYDTAPDERRDVLGPVSDPRQLYYSSDITKLSSSEPGRRPPSATRTQTTTGSIQYPDGFPIETSGLRPQSATGYGATPEEPVGEGYVLARIPFRHQSPMRSRYKEYKKTDKDYAASVALYEEQAKIHATTINPVGGGMRGKDEKGRPYRYDVQGHQAMMDSAHSANMAGLIGATNRLNFTSDHYGRLPREDHDGHLTEAANLANYGQKDIPAQLIRAHEHYARGGTPQDWQQRRRGYEISKNEWAEMERTRTRDQRDAREYRESHGHNQHGRRLSNGKYEWIDVGGGRKRYWSDEYDDYVDSRYCR